MEDPGLELQCPPQSTVTPTNEETMSGRPNEILASDLARIDGGKDAWMFVACGFVFETVLWGFGFSFGVFQSYYTSAPDSPFLDASPEAISAVGTTSLAIMLMGMMFLIPVFQRFAHHGKLILWSALVVGCASLVASSFATQVWQLILLQGVLFGLAGGLVYLPVLLWLPEWFVARRGLAAGVIFSGTGVGGTVLPLMLGALLQRVGFRWTIRIWAAFMTTIASWAVWHVKPRIPASASREARRAPLDISFWKNPLFALLSLTVWVQALAYFPVSLYISTYTAALGLPPLEGQLVLSIFNLFLVVGQIAFGHLCDRIPYARVMIFSAAGSALSAYLLWGFANSLGMVFAFVIAFGSLSGGFTSALPLAATDVAGSDPATVGLAFSFFCTLTGLSAVIGPIVAGTLYTPGAGPVGGSYGGHGFGKVTLFVGTMMVATAAGGVSCIVTSYLRQRQRLITIGHP